MPYITSSEAIPSSKMNKSELTAAIYQGLKSLNDTNQMLHDYWVSELFTVEGDVINDAWNFDNLRLIENDVMYQQLA